MVSIDPHRAGRRGNVDRLAVSHGQRQDRFGDLVSKLAGIETAQLQVDVAGSVASQIEDVRDQLLHAVGVAFDRLEKLLGLRFVRVGSGVQEQADTGPDGGQRRSELVRNGGEQVRPQTFQILQLDGQPVAGQGRAEGLVAQGRQGVAGRIVAVQDLRAPAGPGHRGPRPPAAGRASRSGPRTGPEAPPPWRRRRRGPAQRPQGDARCSPIYPWVTWDPGSGSPDRVPSGYSAGDRVIAELVAEPPHVYPQVVGFVHVFPAPDLGQESGVG